MRISEKEFKELQASQNKGRDPAVISMADFKKYGHIARGRQPRRVPGTMNKTEENFSEYLQSHRLAGLIVDWWYEALTFRVFDDTRYTPDFAILENDLSFVLVEVKSSYSDKKKEGKVHVISWDDSMVKLKWVAQMFPFRCKLAVLQPDKINWEIKEI